MAIEDRPSFSIFETKSVSEFGMNKWDVFSEIYDDSRYDVIQHTGSIHPMGSSVFPYWIP